jgi:hypothetical protein
VRAIAPLAAWVPSPSLSIPPLAFQSAEYLLPPGSGGRDRPSSPVDRVQVIQERAGLQLEQAVGAVLYGTDDAREGIAAFVAKRKPRFDEVGGPPWLKA